MVDSNKIITHIAKKILGSEDEFTIEQRCVIGIGFFTSLAMYASMVLNFFIKLPWQMVLCVLFFGFFCTVFYYHTRFKKRFKFSFWIILSSGSLFFVFGWFFNGGISGPSIIIVLIIIFLLNLIATKFQRNFTAAVTLIIVSCLFLIQYYQPDMVAAYDTRYYQFIDYYVTFLIGVLITSFVSNFIMNSYRLERAKSRIAKKKLKQSEYLFRTLAETTSTAIMLYQNNRFIYLNPAVEHLSGYSSYQLKSMNTWELFHPDYKEKIKKNSKMREQGLKAETGYEVIIITKSGEKKWVYVEGGTAEYYGIPAGLVVMIDITRLKQSEEELINLRSFLANIIDSIPSVLVGIDSATKVTQWNLQAEKLTGVLDDKASGKTLVEVLPILKGKLEKIQRVVLGNGKQENFRLNTHDKGQNKYLDVTVSPLLGQKEKGAVIRIDDITKTVKLGEMITQSEKMLSVGGLAAGMAHEINNPLAGMMQNAQLVLNRLTMDLPANNRAAEKAGITLAAIRDYMDRRDILHKIDNINIAGIHAAKIVENMLSFAKKGDSIKSECSLPSLIDKTLELAQNHYDLKQKYDFKQIKIIHGIEPDFPMVVCEESKIIQVVLNIIQNAAQAMHEGGKPIKNPTLIFRLNRDKSMVRMEIEDNGPGMEEETRKRIFEPFYTTKPDGIGTGLGLSVSYFIITENHGGRMWVESSPGFGAKFIILLPLGKRKV